jgi:acyl dehydratase
VRYFEDLVPGSSYELGENEITEADIIEFARKFDPQPFHTDPRAAKASVFGGLIASGWHTTAIWMRQYADRLLADAASLGSPGVDELRWLKPVRPGDRLRGRLEVLEARVSASRPDMGIVRFAGELRNGDGETVLRMVGTGLFGRRLASP